MRNKLIAFFLPLVFAAKAFSASAGSACDWVDQEALVALGLENAVSKVLPNNTGVQGSNSCTISASDAPPSLIVTIQPLEADFVLKPICDWLAPQLTGVEMGICYMNYGHTFTVLTLIVPSPSDMPSTLSAQVERLYNKHLESAPK